MYSFDKWSAGGHDYFEAPLQQLCVSVLVVYIFIPKCPICLDISLPRYFISILSKQLLKLSNLLLSPSADIEVLGPFDLKFTGADVYIAVHLDSFDGAQFVSFFPDGINRTLYARFSAWELPEIAVVYFAGPSPTTE
jgi:hypothetical protein